MDQVSIFFSRESSPLSHPTWATCISSTGRWIPYHWIKREAVHYNSVFQLVSADMDLQIDYSWPSLYMNSACPISSNADRKYLKTSINLKKPKWEVKNKQTPLLVWKKENKDKNKKHRNNVAEIINVSIIIKKKPLQKPKFKFATPIMLATI